MVNLDISNAESGSPRPRTLDFVIPNLNTDGVTSQKETVYENPKWTEYFGKFSADPHLKNSILLRSTWTIGRGWTTDSESTVIMKNWKGWGKDTAKDILYNADVIASINGDSYAEIIWNNKEREFPVNLKPLNPGTMRIVVNDKGIIIRYEQLDRTGTAPKVVKTFDPEDIFHLSLDRMADQIHGTSLVPSLAKIITAQAENFEDLQKVMHRQAKPLIMFKLKTDNVTKIGQFKSKMEEAMRMSTDNIIYIPDDENIISYEVVQIQPSQLLIEWKNSLRKDFYSTVGSPELLSDSSGSTESGGKIGYLAFSQLVEKRQLFFEEQVWNQLRLKINLYPPESISPQMQSDEGKDAQNALTFQPNDTTAGVGK